MSKGFFENVEIIKTGHDIKNDISLLRKIGIELKGAFFDTAIAAYILNPTRDTYYCDDIAS